MDVLSAMNIHVALSTTSYFSHLKRPPAAAYINTMHCVLLLVISEGLQILAHNIFQINNHPKQSA